jgi:hypothetical protein
MNENIDFWRMWSRNDKWPLFFGLFLLTALVCFGLFFYLKDIENILHWDVLSELHEKIIATNSFFYDEFKFSASTPVWYIKERYIPSLVEINQLAFYILLGSGFIGLSMLLTGLARLKGIWFLIGALVIGGFVISLRIESVFLSNSNLPFLLVFVIIGGFYYYTNNFYQNLSTLATLVIWIFIWSILVLLANKYSAINQPNISLVAYGLVGFLVILAVFIFLISHEIIAGLVWLVSKNSQKGKNSLPQFLIIALIFLANVLLVYLENTKRIEKSSFVISPIILFITSSLLGIWGFRLFLHQKDWFSFQKSGAWIYLGMATISMATVGFIFGTNNDPLIDLFEDFVGISLLAVGLTFIVYVLINYIQIFKQGLEVHKVLYKAPFNKLIYARTISVFLILFLFSLSNFHSFYQAKAGLNNAIGDFYLAEGDLKAAETFYKESTHSDLYNHKANVSLASLALSQGDKINAAFFFNQTLEQKPSPYTFAGLSASLENENLYFEALFALQKGLRKYPNNSHLLINLANLQEKSKLTDSVLINLDLALKNCKKCEVENTNFLAFWIENAKSEKLEEMSNLVKDLEYNGLQANRFAVSRMLEKESVFTSFELSKDSALDMSRAALLFNAVSNSKTINQTKVNAEIIKKLQNNAYNEPVFESLSWTYAQQNYIRESKAIGIKQLYLLANSNTKYKKIYNQNLGLWLMKEGVLDQALLRLKAAGDSSSAALLTNANLQQKVEKDLQAQSDEFGFGISLENYLEVLKKAPFNPYLIERIANFLTSKNKKLEAYKVPFYAAEVNTESALIWKTLVKKALDISEYEYAQDGIKKLETLLPSNELANIKKQYKEQKEKVQSAGF